MNDITTKMQRGVFLPKGSPHGGGARRCGRRSMRSRRTRISSRTTRRSPARSPTWSRPSEVERIFERIRNVDPEVKQVLRESVGAEQ